MLSENRNNFKTVSWNDHAYSVVNVLGFQFFIDFDKDKKIIKDLETVINILKDGKTELTPVEKMQLLRVYNVAYHDSGKIEGSSSLDSSAHGCGFCAAMREAAKNNPLHICGMCYDFAQENSYKGRNILNRHSLNLLIMSTVEFTIDELATLPATEIVRINSSGDTENIIYARNMIKYVYAHTYTKTAYWAKNIAPIIAACKELGKPENLILVQSSPIIGHPAKLAEFFDYVFTVYVTKEATEAAIKDGSCACNGKKCAACGFKCYKGLWPIGSNIAEFLRVDAKTRKTIVAYEAAKKAREEKKQ